jgi:uncharacterized protein
MANWGNIFSRGNVEDRRSFGPVAARGISLTGLALLLIFNFLSGGDIGDILGQIDVAPTQQTQPLDNTAFEGDDDYEVFASKVLGSNNDMWRQKFSERNLTYNPPKLVLFRSSTYSSCGTATSRVGPHYCPLDKTIYLDETFFDELTNILGAKGGDVAEAYVISHEVGHHTQNELGILGQQNSGSLTAGDSNELSVKIELQADCFAGLWVNSIRDLNILEPGEVYEAMDAAEAVGDDRIQEKVTGYINPENWTHGSSEQRVFWFNKGYQEGNMESCDTFR